MLQLLLTRMFHRGIEITEALRLQMEVQKNSSSGSAISIAWQPTPFISYRKSVNVKKSTFGKPIQRKLQLRIEEQGKYLRMMFEKRFKSGDDDLLNNSSSTMVENPSAQPIDEEPNSLVNDDPEVPKGSDPPVPVKCSEKLREEQNVSETEDQDDHDGNAACKSTPPPSKRAKVHE
ncbi:hypothetical protein LIER_35686 [Lithospermum erythrorhizon]|uniref:MYB-CC type transcription factor LHEQLE-containing domain-containing protein n=1 Tax=Lithospermum erythrorhizon TaxID=34254 RepID=A0AAV3NXH3_LITER